MSILPFGDTLGSHHANTSFVALRQNRRAIERGIGSPFGFRLVVQYLVHPVSLCRVVLEQCHVSSAVLLQESENGFRCAVLYLFLGLPCRVWVVITRLFDQEHDSVKFVFRLCFAHGGIPVQGSIVLGLARVNVQWRGRLRFGASRNEQMSRS